jgi:hypothetical protein
MPVRISASVALVAFSTVLSGCTHIDPNALERNARLACAQLGIPPASPEIGDCAVNLQTKLSMADHDVQ